MSVKIDVVYEGTLHCKATHGPSGVEVTTDAPVDNGGKGSSFSPTDLVATALGGCMLTIMGLVAQRNNLDITGTRAIVSKEMVSAPVRRIGALKTKIVLPKGKTFTAADRTKLEQAAKSCPVKQSLHPDVAIEIEFEYE